MVGPHVLSAAFSLLICSLSAASPKAAQYGTWNSPISADTVVDNSIKIPLAFVDPITSSVYHIESRPRDAGRCVIVDTVKDEDVYGSGWNAQTRVQEYGGGAAIAYGGVIYFSNFGDLRVYKLDVEDGGEPVAVTPDNLNYRFADFAVLPTHPHLLVSILEDHTNPAPSDVETSLVVINTSAKTILPVVSGADFYSSLSFSPDGKYAVWLQWYHPDMPWEGSELYVAKVAASSDGQSFEFVERKFVGGVRGQVSVAYPFWASNETVLFTSDISGYQNPWSYSTITGISNPILPAPVEKDFSLPAWYLGDSYGAALDKKGEQIIYSVMQDGRAVLYLVYASTGQMLEIESPYVEILSVRSLPKPGGVVFFGAQSSGPQQVVSLPPAPLGVPSFGLLNISSFKIIKSVSSPTTSSLSPGIISVPQPITIKVPPNDDLVYLNFYPPTNPDYDGGEGGEKPPCVVGAHGGPTMVSTRVLDWSVQYFTSRGWAWVDVNYGGSCGYGRKFIDRLRGQWGVSDIRECILTIQHLSKLNLIDPSRIFIRGRSAGGFTALTGISNPPPGTPSDFKWTGATSIYGISDLVEWNRDMHKFQRGYLIGLLGGSYEEIPEVYEERSSINHADNIYTPLLIQHGTDDPIVLPFQAELMFDALEERGREVEFLLFQGEGHVPRQPENIEAGQSDGSMRGLSLWAQGDHIKEGLEAELNWYGDRIGISNTGTEL